jgi:putative transposase
MRKSTFTEEQIAYALRQAESGTPILEVCRKLGISEQTFYRWKKQFAGMGVAELRRLRQLEEEHRQRKQLVADRRWTAICCQGHRRSSEKSCKAGPDEAPGGFRAGRLWHE